MMVGSNAVLSVGNYLELGHTPADVTGFEASANVTGGQLTITRGGMVHANQIKPGLSSNSIIT